MEQSELAALLNRIKTLDADVESFQSKLTATRAVGPENGGTGEAEKAALITGWLTAMGIQDIIHVDCPDERVPAKKRPNLIATIPGKSPSAVWFFAHMDVVSPGDPGLWKNDPWTVVRNGDLLIGRGVEDNQQGLVSMLLLAKALHEEGITPQQQLKFVFLSDEECGNSRGLAWVLAQRPDLFSSSDVYIVPDSGSPSGEDIEIAEKSILQLKITVQGTQCHASTPQKGANACVAAADVLLALTGLANDFKEKNELFSPPKSTFVPTRHEENVSSVNILPGTDIFYMDCRLLPGISPEQVIIRARERAELVAKRRGTSVTVEKHMLQPASCTPLASPAVQLLGSVLQDAGITPHPIGVGGGTVAALLRAKGLSSVVWSTISGCCHEPEEHSSIQATLQDAAIFARVSMHHGN